MQLTQQLSKPEQKGLRSVADFDSLIAMRGACCSTQTARSSQTNMQGTLHVAASRLRPTAHKHSHASPAFCSLPKLAGPQAIQNAGTCLANYMANITQWHGSLTHVCYHNDDIDACAVAVCSGRINAPPMQVWIGAKVNQWDINVRIGAHK